MLASDGVATQLSQNWGFLVAEEALIATNFHVISIGADVHGPERLEQTAWLIVITSRRLGAERRAAFAAGLTYGLCTFAWPQARSTLSDVQATFLLFLSFHQLVKVRERYVRFRAPHKTDLILFGLALGGAFLTRMAVALAIPPLLIAFLFVVRFGRDRLGTKARPLFDLTLGLVPAALGLGFWLWINHVRFGNPLESGYGEAVGPNYFSYPPHLGLAMLLTAPGKGLVLLAPAFLLAIPWIARGLFSSDRLGPWTVLFVVIGVFTVLLPEIEDDSNTDEAGEVEEVDETDDADEEAEAEAE